jgi:hypothetical protein
LKEAGITTKISPDDVCSIAFKLSKAEDSNKLKAFLNLVASNKHPLLPNLRDVLDAIRHSDSFQESLCQMSAETIRLFVDTFGPTLLAHSFSHFKELIRDFSKETVDLHIRLGLIDLNVITTEDSNYGTLFSYVRSAEAMEWLLQNMSKEDACRLLRSRRRFSYTATFHTLCRPEVVQKVCNALGDVPGLFAFEIPYEFTQAADLCIRHAGCLESLRLITESTGLHNISAEVQTEVMWKVCSKSKGPELLDYWLQVVTSPANSTPPNLLHSCSTWTTLQTDIQKSGAATQIPHVFLHLRAIFFEQAQEHGATVLGIFLSNLAVRILEASSVNPEEKKPADFAAGFEFMVTQIFSPLAGICANRHCSPSCFVLQRISDSRSKLLRGSSLSAAERLLDICSIWDFPAVEKFSPVADEKLDSHAEFIHLLVGHDAENLADPLAHTVIIGWYKRIIDKFIDRIDIRALDTVRGDLGNAMDALLLWKNEDAMSYLPSLINIMVKRGCRISSNDRSSEVCKNANPEALELYFEAVCLIDKP